MIPADEFSGSLPRTCVEEFNVLHSIVGMQDARFLRAQRQGYACHDLDYPLQDGLSSSRSEFTNQRRTGNCRPTAAAAAVGRRVAGRLVLSPFTV